MKIIIVAFTLFLLPNLFAIENSAWIKSTYFRGYDPITMKPHNIKDIEQLAQRLKINHIKYAYVFAGPYQKDGHLPTYAFSKKVKENIIILKKIYPQIKILPWIGGVQNKTVHLEREEWIKNAIADTAKLLKIMPIDGIHLDLEYVLYPRAKFNHNRLSTKDYSRYWVKFHKELRLVLPKSFISSVVVSIASGTKPWKHKHTLSEIKELSSVVDQISFMFYETSLMDLKDYHNNLKEQIIMIKELKSSASNRSQYLIGLGVFNEEKKLKSYRDLGFKNLPLSLKLLQEVENEVGQKKPVVDGFAIFCEWMMTEFEWKQLRSHLK